MKIRPTSGHLWAISLPLIAAGIGETIVDVTDTIFLGRYGITELGAVALADAMYEMLIVLVIGLGDGIQVMVARRAGQGDPRAVGRAFNQGLYLLGITALVLMVAIKAGSPLLAAFTVSSEPVREAVNGFLQIVAYGTLFTALNLAWGVFFVSISRTRALVGAVIVLALTNIALDYGLVFGNLGLPRMGIKGAALASVTAEVAMFVFMTIYAWRRGYIRRYGLFAFERWSRPLTRVLLVISGPVALEALVETLRWFLFFVIIEQISETALAGANIVYTIYVVLLIPAEAFAEAACSMVSNLIGQGMAGRMGLLLRRAIRLGSLTTLPFLVLVLAFPDAVMSIFTSHTEAIASARNSLPVILLALVTGIPGEILLSAVAGTGDTRAALVIELILTVCVLALAGLAAFVLELPLEFIWLTVVVGWIIRIVLSWLRLRQQAWRGLEV